MRSRVFVVAVLAALAWNLDGQAEDGPESLLAPPTSQNIQAQRAVVPWRQVAWRARGTQQCPAVDGWSVEGLLPQGLPQLPAKWPRAKSSPWARWRRLGLDRVCLYTWSEPGKSVPAFAPNGQLPAGLVKAGPERLALAGATLPADSFGPLALRDWITLRDHFLEQAGRTAETQRWLRETGRPKTRLVFLDSEPTGEGLPAAPGATDPGRSFHGYTLAHLAHQLLCGSDEASCAIETATHLTLPYRDYDALRAPASFLGRGGNLGLLSDLAAALVTQTWKWLLDARPERPRHLVINLSLGWDGELFGDLAARRLEELDTDVFAVHQALAFARASGVLVVAAAGNERGGPEKPTSPLFPAVWELRRPERWVCPWEKKLVWAVGGIDWQGLPLANARSGGKPRRSAYGDHAVVGTALPGTDLAESPTLILTGSSVATAVTSAMAAALWQQRPELAPEQVMELLDRSAETLRARADFYRGSWLRRRSEAPELRRLSLCRALALARGRGEVCPAWRPEPPLLLRPSIPPHLAFTERVPYVPTPPCPATRLMTLERDRGPADACPAERFGEIASQRFLFPQPPNNPCMGCSLIPGEKGLRGASGGPSYVLQLELGPSFRELEREAPIEAATLDIERFDGDRLVTRMTYEIPLDALAASADEGRGSFQLELADGDSLWGCRARLNLRVRRADDAITSLVSPVLVDP